jgi:16S rRNA (adenine1518-N6/adenine1519-N6)-dimethyltransferase
VKSSPAKKRFGQHFLEPAWVKKVVQAIGPEAGETFLEIGPGRGAITVPLAEKSAHVFAFEIDRDLAAGLAASAPGNVTVVEGDFLECSSNRIAGILSTVSRPTGTRLRAAGNLPYNVASPILFKLRDFYADDLPIVDATVMMQREVADRLLAPPGTREYGVLSVLLRLWADVERLLLLPPGAFRPAPRVHSAVVRLRFHPPSPAPKDAGAFENLVGAVFSRRRKMLSNALLAYEPSARLPPAKALAEAGLDGRRRPETLEIAELVRLADVFGPAML